MRKSDKKREKSIVAALTEACEEALKQYDGFQWLTHVVDYQSFPESLTIICVFDTNQQLTAMLELDKGKAFKQSIDVKLRAYDILIKDIKKRIVFDTEEACHTAHQGDWEHRLKGLSRARHV